MIPSEERDRVRDSDLVRDHRTRRRRFTLRARCWGEGAIAIGRLGTAPVCGTAKGGAPGRRTSGSDLTDFKALETQFHQSQQLESVARLAGRVAHDFNNLLTVIVGYSGVLLEKNPSDSARIEPERDPEGRRKRSGPDAAAVRFRPPQVFPARALNLTTLLADDVHMIRHLIGENVQLVTHLDPSLGLVRADPGHLHQIILNLVVNARDAMPDGGTLTISTSNICAGAGATRLPAVMSGDFVQLAITDTGTGMTEEVRSHLFEPFYTTKAPGKGTGLGLPTVYGLVQQSGGHIRVETEPDKGTSFKILLPAVAGEAERAPDLHTEGRHARNGDRSCWWTTRWRYGCWRRASFGISVIVCWKPRARPGAGFGVATKQRRTHRPAADRCDHARQIGERPRGLHTGLLQRPQGAVIVGLCRSGARTDFVGARVMGGSKSRSRLRP